MRVAITGTPCTGKSTLAKQLATKMEWQYIPETFASLFDEQGGYIQPPSVLAVQMDKVLMLKRQLEFKHVDTVSDRCSADLFILWLSRGFSKHKQVAEFADKCRDYLRHYDAFIYLPWGVLPLEQLEEGESGCKRNMDQWTQFYNNSALIGLIMQWVPAEKRIFIPTNIIDLETRADYVLSRLNTVSQ